MQSLLFFVFIFAFSHLSSFLQAQNYEFLTDIYFAKIKYQNDSAKIADFVKAMPKGGDIHHHFTGAIPVDIYLDWAEKAGKRYNTNTKINSIFVNPPCKNCISIKELRQNKELLSKWSIKGFPLACDTALNPLLSSSYFFNVPNFSAGLELRNEQEGFLFLKKQALSENIQYIESIFEAPSSKNLKVKIPASYEDSLKFYQDKKDSVRVQSLLFLILKRMEADAAHSKYIQNFILKTKKSHQGIDDSLFTLKLQTYVFRLQNNITVFKDLYTSFKTVALDTSGLFVGVNIVGPENNEIALKNYWLHMQMFRVLRKQYPQVRVAIHAGELVPALVSPKDLEFHIRDAINIAGAERIGHGVDIAYEKDMFQTLETMKNKKIPIEINLSSNAFILGVGLGKSHPIHLYYNANVPIIISSDDPGVSQSSISEEYFKLAIQHHFTYKQIKSFVYNSIQYSFAKQNQKNTMLRLLDKKFQNFEQKIASQSD